MDRKEENKAWRIEDKVKDEWDERETEKSRSEGADADHYEPKPLPLEEQKKLYEETKRKVLIENPE
jgi:hypothetical protein